MLDHLGEDRAAELVEQATEDVLEAGKVRTFDIGGKSTCSDMGDAIAERLLQLKPSRIAATVSLRGSFPLPRSSPGEAWI
jgi:hypothetical protein